MVLYRARRTRETSRSGRPFILYTYRVYQSQRVRIGFGVFRAVRRDFARTQAAQRKRNARENVAFDRAHR